MRKEISTRISGGGVQSLIPRISIAPRQRVQGRDDEREDEADEQASPPPGMGRLVDKLV
ncbi:MAG TPA: hypothetical protein VIJ78_07705 [Pseudolabrys sp.]